MKAFIKKLGGGSYFEYDDNAGGNLCSELFRTVNAKISNIESQLVEENKASARLRQKLKEASLQKDELQSQKAKADTLNAQL